MQDIFFKPSFGNRPRNLVGREKTIERIREALASRPGSRERAMLLLGQRGYGKTVLLLEMADIAREMGYVVASPTVVSSQMQERILEKLYDVAGEILKKEKTKVHTFSYHLSSLCKELGNKNRGILILVDEVQANSEEMRQLVIAYQEIVGEGGDIAIAMAGLPGAISTTLNDKVLTFLNRARVMPLEPLNARDVFAYYKNTFKELGIAITDDLCRRAAADTEGSPYMMQLLGHNIVLYSEDGCCDEKIYEDARSDAREDFVNDIAKTTLNTLSAKDIEFLGAMSQDEDVSRIADISERMGVSSAYAQLYKKRLVDAGVIEKAGRGEIRMALPYLREYLRTAAE